MGFFANLPDRKYEIEDHTEMLAIQKERIAKKFSKRNNMNSEDRSLLRWQVEQAQYHKHMIAQLESLPDFNIFGL